MQTRDAVAAARRVVVKIGSSGLTSLSGGLDLERLDRLVDALEARMAAGSDVLVVSSGAIAAGIAPLGLRARPRDLATQQAAAAVGQLELVQAWRTSFARYGRTVGQVLLTAEDVARRSQHRNAQRTLDRLRVLGVVPIVNENDTVATAEIRFGDNDRLAALVSHLVSADAMVLLSDVAGLYDGDPRQGGATLIREVSADGAELDGVVAGSGGTLGTGGMASKLTAARLAADAGVPVLLASAAQAPEALGDAQVGTAFAARARRLSARRFWVRYAAETSGSICLDAGAVSAVIDGRRSLLLPGITAVKGDFHASDVVRLIGPDGTPVARGVVAFDAAELAAMVGVPAAQLPPELRRPVVHADDLVRA
ncbi:glutamate 5-kinase [Rhodococcus sp. X156]|uniref:glutamate 5-kinase n=1 Tax=Rhodococcus sp. X156 TaxID=2499145 RepID=UPI000FD6ED54|nr:glutamate 5-kinase [Rhodococcus sp. X156]